MPAGPDAGRAREAAAGRGVPRPLRNRVDPFGAIHAVPERGTLMGNRGGRFHDPATGQLAARGYAGRRWLCCRLDFRGRHHAAMGTGYTSLFFLDEPTALAAGHRPCFECRNADATAFAQAWGKAHGTVPNAAAMDEVLHAERLAPVRQVLPVATLPDGAFVIDPAGRPAAIRGKRLLSWSFAGYGEPGPWPRKPLPVLTPPSTLAVLRAGYRPRWHATAG